MDGTNSIDTSNMRPYEGWMQKGIEVQLPNNKGIMINFLTGTIGDTKYILSALVQPHGCKAGFAFNAWEIDPVKA